MMKKNKNAFTLVELLTVIVILAIILVIAVPKVVNIIYESKKATLESTAKMIASEAEKVKVQNSLLGKIEDITCDSVAKLNDVDYAYCGIEFNDNVAQVDIKGSGKFEGLNVCSGTKITATASDENCPILYGKGSTYITKLQLYENELNNGLQKTTATYTGSNDEEIILDTGIRYVGALDDVNNKVYFNCEETDGTNQYGSENYKYDEACEKWRIIGVFDVEDGNGNTEKRIKIVNRASTFEASWDSSENSINTGLGVNQWGESIYIDSNGKEQPYPGADLMQLLNGYYIGKSGSECKYNTGGGQGGFSNTCTIEGLMNKNMRPLTNVAKTMIDDAIWYTYASYTKNTPDSYLYERGIAGKYTGCLSTVTVVCTNDNIIRNNVWTGLVGLMTISDIGYADGWLTNLIYGPWTITPYAYSSNSSNVYRSKRSSFFGDSAVARYSMGIWPSVYLNANIQIVGGNGNDKPYILK